MDDFYKALLQMSPQGQGLLGLAEPERPTGAGAYLRELPGVMPGLFNFDSPQIVERPEMYTPLIEQPAAAAKEPEVLKVDTGGAEMAQSMHPAVLAFLDNEAKTPGARDGRMGAINNALTTPFAAMGLLGDKATNALSLVIGQIANAMRADKGIQDGRNVPVVDMMPTSYAPNSLAEGVGGGYSVGTPDGYGAIGAQGADPDSGSFGISVI